VNSLVSRKTVDRDVKERLRVHCAECSEALEVPLPVTVEEVKRLVDDHAWYLSVATPPDQLGKVPMVLELLCASCGYRCLPPDVRRAADAARKKGRPS
jgi:hypothetical protein